MAKALRRTTHILAAVLENLGRVPPMIQTVLFSFSACAKTLIGYLAQRGTGRTNLTLIVLGLSSLRLVVDVLGVLVFWCSGCCGSRQPPMLTTSNGLKVHPARSWLISNQGFGPF